MPKRWNFRVLSDAQERAWYDKHRDAILRGGQGYASGDFKEERLDVFQFFSRSCFEDFDDGPRVSILSLIPNAAIF